VKAFVQLRNLLNKYNMNLDELLFSLLEKIVVNGILFETSGLLVSLTPLTWLDMAETGGPMPSFLSFLEYLGVISRSQGIIRLTSEGKSLWRALNPRKRCLMLVDLLKSRNEEFSEAIESLRRVGRISKSWMRTYSEVSFQREMALIGLLWMEDYGLIERDGEDYVLTEGGSALLSKAQAKMESGEPAPCPFHSYLRDFAEVISTRECTSLLERKNRLLELGRRMRSPDLEESELKGILEEFISEAFTMEWAGDSLNGYVKELTSSAYVSSLGKFLSKVIVRGLGIPKERIASFLFEIFSEKLTPLATELLTAIDPLRFGIYDERIYRLVTVWELDLDIFDRQAPHYEGLSADYYVRFCDFMRELRKCLSRYVDDVDNFDVYLFMRYVEESEGRFEGEQPIPSGSTEEILQKLGLNYQKHVVEGESPELSEVTFRERFPILEKSGERGRSLLGMKMYRHQLEVDEALSSGKNVILISGTGSGKTESWVLHALREGKRVLAVYPTLALSGDQEVRIRDYFEAVGSEKVFKLDAKVVREYSRKRDKRLLRKRINLSTLIITNPAFLMSDLKRMAVGESYLEKFLQNSDLIVIDELDYYGSSGASLLIGGMLSLLYRYFLTTKKPQIAILTATLGNPEEVKDALTNLNDRDTSIIEGKPFRLRNTTFLLLDKEAEVKLPLLLSSIAMNDGSGITLVFTRSINDAEQLVRRIRANLPVDMQELARTHHHLVSKEERREIEEQARRGEIRLIVTPKTLIQGVDIGTVKRVVHYGLPTDVREYRQREGRKGRRRELGSSETIILPIRKWDHKLIEGGPEFLFRWTNLPPERIIVNPENKYIKLFESLYKVKSPFLASRMEENELKLLRDLGLIERVEMEGMTFDDLTEEALNKVWKYLNFYGYGPPYGYRRYHLRSKELLSEEEVSLPDLVEKFQPGCIDYSTSMIVVRYLRGGKILEDDLYHLENSRIEVGNAIRSFKAEYERIKKIWGEKIGFYGDFQYGKIFSRVDLLVRPPKEPFGLLREIPLSVKWVVEGEGTKPVEFDGIVRERFLSHTVELPVKTAGIYSLYTYGRAFSLDPLEDVTALRLGMAFLISLLKLELNLSLDLVRYIIIESYTASQLVLWEPNPVGVLEMPHLWRSLRGIVERHKPDHLTKIYMWAVDREIVDLKLGRVDWEDVKRSALRALDYIESSFAEIPLYVDLSSVKPSRDLKVASFDLIDLSPLIPREKALAIVFDGEEYRHFEMPKLESLKGEELAEDDYIGLFSFFDVLDSLIDEGFKLVHFSRGEEFTKICNVLGTFTKMKCEDWRKGHRVVDLHEKLVEKLGIDIIPIESVERVIGGFPGREVSFDDLVEAFALRGEENADEFLVKKYAEDNVRSIYLLYLALIDGSTSQGNAGKAFDKGS